MPRRAKPLPFVEAMKKLNSAGLANGLAPNRPPEPLDLEIPSLEQRLRQLLNIIHDKSSQPTYMLFFVMYDIQSNKVRRLVVRYLQQQGCVRVQKSIFLANLPNAAFQQIKSDLAEVQACYDNQDSILVVPISTDHLRAMKVIGQEVNVDLITHSRNTLFF